MKTYTEKVVQAWEDAIAHLKAGHNRDHYMRDIRWHSADGKFIVVASLDEAHEDYVWDREKGRNVAYLVERHYKKMRAL